MLSNVQIRYNGTIPIANDNQLTSKKYVDDLVETEKNRA
jgi:hypothetical protein